jgi:hypothetical protein
MVDGELVEGEGRKGRNEMQFNIGDYVYFSKEDMCIHRSKRSGSVEEIIEAKNNWYFRVDCTGASTRVRVPKDCDGRPDFSRGAIFKTLEELKVYMVKKAIEEHSHVIEEIMNIK